MIRLETLIEPKVVRAYPLIEIKKTAPFRAIRGSSISVNSNYPPHPLLMARRDTQAERPDEAMLGRCCLQSQVLRGGGDPGPPACQLYSFICYFC